MSPLKNKNTHPQGSFLALMKKEYCIEELLVFYVNEIGTKHMSNDC